MTRQTPPKCPLCGGRLDPATAMLSATGKVVCAKCADVPVVKQPSPSPAWQSYLPFIALFFAVASFALHNQDLALRVAVFATFIAVLTAGVLLSRPVSDDWTSRLDWRFGLALVAALVAGGRCLWSLAHMGADAATDMVTPSDHTRR